MKKINQYLFLAVIALAASFTARAEDTKPTETKPVPDNLATCVVSGEKLGGDMSA